MANTPAIVVATTVFRGRSDALHLLKLVSTTGSVSEGLVLEQANQYCQYHQSIISIDEYLQDAFTSKANFQKNLRPFEFKGVILKISGLLGSLRMTSCHP